MTLQDVFKGGLRDFFSKNAFSEATPRVVRHLRTTGRDRWPARKEWVHDSSRLKYFGKASFSIIMAGESALTARAFTNELVSELRSRNLSFTDGEDARKTRSQVKGVIARLARLKLSGRAVYSFETGVFELMPSEPQASSTNSIDSYRATASYAETHGVVMEIGYRALRSYGNRTPVASISTARFSVHRIEEDYLVGRTALGFRSYRFDAMEWALAEGGYENSSRGRPLPEEPVIQVTLGRGLFAQVVPFKGHSSLQAID